MAPHSNVHIEIKQRRSIMNDTAAKVWTSKEDELLKRNAGLLNRAELANVLGRSTNAIAQRAVSLGVSLRTKKLGWTHEEKKRLVELRDLGSTWAEISEDMSRSEGGCRKAYTRILREKEAKSSIFDPSMERKKVDQAIYTLYTNLKSVEDTLPEATQSLLKSLEYCILPAKRKKSEVVCKDAIEKQAQKV